MTFRKDSGLLGEQIEDVMVLLPCLFRCGTETPRGENL